MADTFDLPAGRFSSWIGQRFDLPESGDEALHAATLDAVRTAVTRR